MPIFSATAATIFDFVIGFAIEFTPLRVGLADLACA
jgi:hypothetical protein